jgi:hypothetical protein
MKVTKWSIVNGELTVSEHQAEQTSSEGGSLNAGVSHPTPSEPVTAAVVETSQVSADAAKATPEPVAAEIAAADAKAPETSAAEPPEAKASTQASRPEAAKPEISQIPSKVIVLPRGDRAWADNDINSEPKAARHHGVSGRPRIAAIAAVAALAAVAGALGGAFATATFMHGGSEVVVNGNPSSLGTSLARVDADVQALKAGLDHTSKLGMNQFNKTSDRLEKLERAQAEPALKLAKLSEAVDRLRTGSNVAPVAAVATASKEITGSIGPAQQAAAAPAGKTDAKTDVRADAKADVKNEVGRLPTLDDWVLRDVENGSALISSRRGYYEVYAGDIIPGLGRIGPIRRQDGRWVVVTSRGLIVAR